ncbi:MAG: ATP-binding protein [Armatimonadetes bacterium]|nr:ATP-binding protein [Armatimonadota bacterium]
MLISFRTENFRSFRDTGQISLVVPNWVESDHLVVSAPGDLRLGTVAAIYGSNASGKTNVVRAIWRMSVMVANSHQSWKPSSKLPHEPFFADPHDKSPTMFEADVILDGERYQYGFRFGRERFLEEWLYTFPKGRPRLMFDRDVRRENEFRFGRGLRGRPHVIADLTRENSLFLSAAAANNHEELSRLAQWFDRGVIRAVPVDVESRLRDTVGRLQDATYKERILNLLKFADLGISDAKVVANEVDEEFKDKVSRAMQAIDPEINVDDFDWNLFAQGTQLGHRVDDGLQAFLDLDEESQGTRVWLGLIGWILSALDHGRLLLVDELDASLHPRLSSEVIRIFHDPDLNGRGAQLVFNSHDPSLLGALVADSPLRRDEVWLTEKMQDGATRLYPLTDFRPRRAENLERGYLQGRYGAVPFVDRDYAAAAFGPVEEGSVAAA